ncbi:hypothetical protein FQN60_012245 [Etheostoma spectabile]|uniref:G-protein coupled receptors family 2 profile 2 domain-containing protein n=1 Tax=Etheostoma spectabile TaxID=54343 RepID=A0A5J5DPE0_9PERO|nr:hypothetical protein FQN60_012245 [Etheostoma spectabile]
MADDLGSGSWHSPWDTENVPTDPHPPSIIGMSQVCLLLALLMLFSSATKVSCTNSLELVKEQWSSYRNQCLDYLNATPPATGNPLSSQEEEREIFLQHQYGRILSQLRIMYTVGYSLSLGALLLALGILITFRKLHCMRNNIHMNLFSSFILRAVSILVKDALLTLTLDPRSNSDTRTQAWVNIPAVTWCRGAMVMMQYSVMANNYWLLVEGIYLHSLLVITVFSERKYFYNYLAIGWGAPLVFVLPWITVKYMYENEECWERNINMGYWWIIRSPILFAYLINFFIFIRIIKILMSKLRAHQMRYTDYKFRLAKSTLTLIPLLGIHAILFTFVIDESGLLVAILYCFVNKEVQSEMLKKWKRWKLGKDIDEEYRHTHSHTPHIKSGSIATGNLPYLQDNNASDPGGDSPRLNKVDRDPTCSTALEDNRRLVVSYSNGTRKGGLAKSRHTLQFSFLLHRGAGSNVTTTTEDARLQEKVQCRTSPLDGEETNV